jgi:hypothetical protein
MKYLGLLSQLRQLRAQLREQQVTRIKIEGGIPPEASTESPEPPPGSDLAHQHATLVGRSSADPPHPTPGNRWRVQSDQPGSVPPAKREQTGS